MSKYVSGSIKRLRRKLKENPDKKQAFKDGALDIVSRGIEDFEKRLEVGQVKVETIADFEKLVKLGLLLHGEATEKIEHTTDVEEISVEQFNVIKESPEFEAIKQRLALTMNKQNEEA